MLENCGPQWLQIFELLEQSKQQSAEDVMAVAATGELETHDDIDDGLVSMLSDDMQSRRGSTNRRLDVYHAAVKALSALGDNEVGRLIRFARARKVEHLFRRNASSGVNLNFEFLLAI